MYPHERSLVKRLEGKPFALLGINSDQNKEDLKKVMAKEQITWRSWFDGGMKGPISTKWGIQGWPTIFVLDHKGVIRYKDVRKQDLDDAVDALMKEAEDARAKKEAKVQPKIENEAAELLTKAKVQLNLKQTEQAKVTLNEIIEKHPVSKQAADANKLLEKIGK